MVDKIIVSPQYMGHTISSCLWKIYSIQPFVDRRVINSRNQKKVGIDNVCENANQVSHDYNTDNLVYMENNGIYR